MDKTFDLFVPGRVCLFGEHSDWAGAYRRFNSALVPGQVIIAVAGPLEHDQVRERVEKLFTIPEGADRPNGRVELPEPRRGLRHVERQLQQQHIWIGRRGMSLSHPDRYGMLILAGPPVRHVRLDTTSMLDITPTVPRLADALALVEGRSGRRDGTR